MYNPLKELERASTKLEGFYRGVVVQNRHEDLTDEETKTTTVRADARIRVKIFGVYDDLAPDEIPWAEPALPINTGGKLDQGSCFIPEVDSYVFCFFDQGDVNHPVYFAMCPSIPNNEEPDIPREARRQKLDETYISTKRNNRIENIESSDGIYWSEPEPWYDAEYPWNHVIKLSNGIVLELDNTTGRERIHIYHPSNTFLEIEKNGDMHVKNNRHKYVLTVENRKEFVGGNSILDIDKSRFLRVTGDERKKVQEEKILLVNDSEHITVDNNRRESVGSNRDLRVDSDKRESVGNDKHIEVEGNQYENIGENLEISIGSDKKIKINGNYSLEVSGNLSFKVGGTFNVDASSIHFQEGTSESVSTNTPSSPESPTKPDEETPRG